MRKILQVLLPLSLLAVGCGDDDEFDTDGDGIPDDEDADDTGPGGGGGSAVVNAWNATVTGIGPNALSGAAIVRQTVGDSTFTANLIIRSDAPGPVRPWHVHFGTCGSGGAIVGADTDYPRMTIGSNGEATSDARINFVLDRGAAYHVNVHDSDLYLGVLIACGDLVIQ